MKNEATLRITDLLVRWRQGDDDAMDELMPRVYDVLHGRALAYMRRERPNHTWSCTDLVNEAWLELAQDRERPLANRRHFYQLAARIMRQALMKHARARAAHKRGGDQEPVHLENWDLIMDQHVPMDVVASVLEELDGREDQMKEMVTLHYLVGLSYDEVAELLGVSRPTVNRRLRLARATLLRESGVKQ